MAPTNNSIPEIVTLLEQVQNQLCQLQQYLQPSATVASSQSLHETWLDSSDVLLQLRISKRTLHNLRTQGRIPYTRMGGKMYYKKADIEQVLQNNYVQEVQYREKERRRNKNGITRQ